MGPLRRADAPGGGFANLYTAFSPDYGTVAIKVFHHTERDVAGFALDRRVADFEYTRLCQMNGAGGHAPAPLAIGTVGEGDADRRVAIAMEYIEGVNIEQAVEGGWLTGGSRGLPNTGVVADVCSKACAALLSCSPVSNRDFSPRSLMVRRDAHAIRDVVVVDFGQSVDSRSSMVTPGMGNKRLATPCFGAPEVFGGPFYHQRNSRATDSYSIGCIAYYMRTGRPPFRALMCVDPTSPEGAASVVAAKRAPIAIEFVGGSEADSMLADVIRSCTDFCPSNRPSISSLETVFREIAAAGGVGSEAVAGIHPDNKTKDVTLPDACRRAVVSVAVGLVCGGVTALLPLAFEWVSGTVCLLF
ncbi:serine/threonine-protein kinase [Slackia heliotrinireducens]|nr:serine/threonine-protein kinase [Slackia heliotrinireducens]